MRIGGCTIIRNEAELIAPLLHYYLEVAGLDLLSVTDNNSHDGTWELLEGELAARYGDRLLLARTRPGTGFIQGDASTRMARELFDRHGCDWVLPLDADEYWICRSGPTLRGRLEALEGDEPVIEVASRDFVLTELDDASEPDFRRRIRHAHPQPRVKVGLRGMAGRALRIGFGNHTAVEGRGEPLPTRTLPPEDLCLFHYPILSLDHFRRKTLTKAEGYLIRYGDEWLEAGRRGEENMHGRHHYYRYMLIREGRFHEEMARNFVLSGDEVARKLEHGRFQKLDDLARLLERHNDPKEKQA
jgi:hypothetical protein